MVDPPANESAGVVRLLDASLNRAAEGLRAAEDYARFVLDDAGMSRLAKELRHGVAAAAEGLSVESRLACRETRCDVGAAISTDSEADRPDAWSVCRAALHRTHEALRSLEEYSKVLDSEAASRFERLRYGSYTLAKGIGAVRRGLERLGDARLYVLIDGGASAERFERLVGSLCEAGVGALQLRDKGLSDRELVDRARAMVRLARPAGVLTVVNDRPDVAAVAGADGVHVGQEELRVKEARSVVGPGGMVGVSTHSLEQAREAVLDGADYLGVGPTFPSQTKAFDHFPGLDLVRAVAAETRLPAFAIGGITTENLGEVLAAGAARVAVSAAVAGAEDPAAAAARFNAALGAPVGGGAKSG